jgi:hypothetical protein
MQTVELTDQQSLRIAELPEEYKMIGVVRSTPFVRKPTGQIMRIQQNGRLTAATIAAKRSLADRPTRSGGAPRGGPAEAKADRNAGAQMPTHTQTQSVDTILRLRHLEGTTQAVLATLRRSLVEKVLPTREGLAHEAAIAFDLEDDQRALHMIDDVAQTVGISGLE